MVDALKPDQMNAWQKFQFYSGITYTRDMTARIPELKKEWEEIIKDFNNPDKTGKSLGERITTFQERVTTKEFETLREKNLNGLFAGICALVQWVVFKVLGIEANLAALHAKLKPIFASVEIAKYGIHSVMCRRYSKDVRHWEVYLEGFDSRIELWSTFEHINIEGRSTSKNILVWKFIALPEGVDNLRFSKGLIEAMIQLFIKETSYETLRVIPTHPNSNASKDLKVILKSLFPVEQASQMDPNQSLDFLPRGRLSVKSAYQALASLADVFNQPLS